MRKIWTPVLFVLWLALPALAETTLPPETPTATAMVATPTPDARKVRKAELAAYAQRLAQEWARLTDQLTKVNQERLRVDGAMGEYREPGEQ